MSQMKVQCKRNNFICSYNAFALRLSICAKESLTACAYMCVVSDLIKLVQLLTSCVYYYVLPLQNYSLYIVWWWIKCNKLTCLKPTFWNPNCYFSAKQVLSLDNIKGQQHTCEYVFFFFFFQNVYLEKIGMVKIPQFLMPLFFNFEFKHWGLKYQTHFSWSKAVWMINLSDFECYSKSKNFQLSWKEDKLPCYVLSIHMCLVFKWSKRGWMLNGLIEYQTGLPFEHRTNGRYLVFLCTGLVFESVCLVHKT